MNNFEKIKQMTIDEMAEKLIYLLPHYCSDCILREKNICIEEIFLNADNPCFSAIKQWLLSEVDRGDNK